MGYLPRRDTNREYNQPTRKKSVVVHRAEQSWRPEEHFDTRHGDAEFGFCPAGFWSCFGPVFSRFVPLLSFGMVMYILCHYMLEVCDLLFDFDFYR